MFVFNESINIYARRIKIPKSINPKSVFAFNKLRTNLLRVIEFLRMQRFKKKKEKRKKKNSNDKDTKKIQKEKNRQERNCENITQNVS